MPLSSQTRIFSDPAQIAPLLRRQFPIRIDELQVIAAAIFRGFVQVSSLHPKGFRGTNAWAEGTSSLRALMIPKGWHVEDPQGQPRVVSKNGKIAITVSSGNADTGVANRVPQTRNDKGTQTAGSVHFNAQQMLLFPLPESDISSLIVPANGQSLWILLYYIDLDARHVRFELSQPTAMSEADKVNSWSTRFILPPLPFTPDFDDRSEDEGPDIDIQVTPKQL